MWMPEGRQRQCRDTPLTSTGPRRSALDRPRKTMVCPTLPFDGHFRCQAPAAPPALHPLLERRHVDVEHRR